MKDAGRSGMEARVKDTGRDSGRSDRHTGNLKEMPEDPKGHETKQERARETQEDPEYV
jgi:hypothetical protein